MKTKIPEKLWEVTGGLETWKHYNVGTNDRDFGYQKYVMLDLSTLTGKRLLRLVEIIEPHSRIKGAAMMLKDIRAWLRVMKGDSTVKPRTVEQFAELLRRFIGTFKRHHVYERDEANAAWLPYYVEDVVYHPPQTYRDNPSPPYVSADLFWMEFGVRKNETIVWHGEDCLHLSVPEAMAKKDLFAETPESRNDYLCDVQKWTELHDKIGLQLRGEGHATDDLDGNERENSWSSYSHNTLRLDHRGSPAKLVVDVFSETDKVEKDRSNVLDEYFWARQNMKVASSMMEEGEDASYEDLNDEVKDEDEIDTSSDLDDEDVHERPVHEIPIHAKLACFDLVRHVRLRVHVRCVEVYKYDTTLAEKLVLPADSVSLIEMLIHNKSTFKDVIAGKGGGSVVLCCGLPGVGKTLTSEVYSEATERPLFSVQCSQLGTDPDKLETELVRVFARAMRWNAILLLDEADVYVMERGDNLIQNAIVGVFLRVLEYYAGTLFLTTNRAERVDDAIASRCVARIDYAMPPIDHQRRLWKILSTVSGVAISDEVIEETLTKYDNLSGRDIKNVIKLAGLMSISQQRPVDMQIIDFVKRFKPTYDAPTRQGEQS